MPDAKPATEYYRTVVADPKLSPILVLESGSGTDPNANAYIDQAFADAYFTGALYADEWNAADTTSKQRALVSATRTLDANCNWKGYRKLSMQPLGWPRVLARNDEAAHGGSAYSALRGTYLAYFDENSIPIYLQQGTAQQALELLITNRSQDLSTKGIASMGLGSGALNITFTGDANSNKSQALADEVMKLVSPVVRSFKGMGYGVRHVTRVP